MTEAIVIFVLIVAPLAAYALGRRSGRNESEEKLAGEKSALSAEQESMLTEAERGRAAVAAGKRENKDTAKTLEQKGWDLDKRRAALTKREQEIKKADEAQRTALEREREEFKSHQESARKQGEFLRNYFLRRTHVDAYVGQDALRKCGGVYVISRRDGLVKVGMTETDFSRRFEEVRRDCERAGIRNIKPEILVPMDEGMAEVESDAHGRLSANREGGEWFRAPVEKAVLIVLDAAWDQHIRNTERRKYMEPLGGGREDDEVRGETGASILRDVGKKLEDLSRNAKQRE